MRLFDFLFGSSQDEEERKRLAKEAERQEHLKAEREQAASMLPFTFNSNCHQRYENEVPVMGLQKCSRTVSVVKNTSGCPGYKLQPGLGYIVKIFNDDLGKPNMSDKPMKVVRKTESSMELRGFPIEAQSPFGWQEVDYSDYGLVVSYKNNKVEKCVLYMYDRNVKIEYMNNFEAKSSTNNNGDTSFDNNVSVKSVAQGKSFNLKFSKIQIVKQPYNGDGQNIEISPSSYARIIRKGNNEVVTFDISNISELRDKGILQTNPTFNPSFTYSTDNEGDEFASAEVGNSFEAMRSGKEYVSLFQITRQKGNLVAFIINNLPNEGDFYYLIIFKE